MARAAPRRIPIDLVLAGRRRADFPEIPAEPGLRVTGLTPEEDLPALYSGAVACLYPSYYEGFGLPVLEAMQCGALVIASRDPAIIEVAADGAILLDVRDRVPLDGRAAVGRDTQPEQMRGLRGKALLRAGDFSWTKTARLTRAVYEHAIRRFRK